MSNVTMPSSKGRNTHPPKRRVPEVEATVCPQEPAGGTHLLTADRGARITCAWCHQTWSSLDAALRPASTP